MQLSRVLPDAKMGRDGSVVMVIIRVMLFLLGLVHSEKDFIQCKLCPGLYGINYCKDVSFAGCVRIIGTNHMREIKLFSCAVRIERIGRWEGQNPVIRDRNNNICIGEYFSVTLLLFMNRKVDSHRGKRD